MNKQMKKQNNQGSALLTVILCIAFISILGTLMLSVTMTNLQMKILESKSKESFYTCEMAMEEIRVGVQEIVAEKIKIIYETEVLNQYATYLNMDEEGRNTDIQKQVVLSLMKSLGEVGSRTDDQILTASDILVYEDFFLSYLSDPTHTQVNQPLLKSDEEGSELRLLGVEIVYLEGDYRSVISSNIVITMPEFSFTEGTEEEHYQLEQPFSDYILLADHNITSDQAVSNASLQGSIYAGKGGIHINGQNAGGNQLNIQGKNIVTQGNITVSDTAKLTIGAPSNLPLIWAENLMTDTSNSYPSGSSQTTDLTINGICIVKDDLVLEGRNSKVSFSSGAYIGYTSTPSAKGSAIMINGAGSSLNLSGLSELILAGRAHVSVEDAANDKGTDILTGESIAFKSNQKAYLLPSEFITDVFHNPLTKADYEGGIPSIDITNFPGGIPYSTYVAATPYKIAAKQTGMTTLRYYYLNFASGKKADAYLREFSTLYPNTLDTLAPFSLGNVILPSAADMYTVGNAMSYNDADKVLLSEEQEGLSKAFTSDAELDTFMKALHLSDPIYDAGVLNDTTVGILEGLYSKISHLLTTESTKVYDDEKETVASYLKAGGVDYILDNDVLLSTTTTFDDFVKLRGDEVITNMDTTKQSFHIVDGNVTITAGSCFQGFLAATGTIAIGDGASIQGILISLGEAGSSGTIIVGNNVTIYGRLVAGDLSPDDQIGTIILGQNCNISTNIGVEDYLDRIFEAEGTILKSLFKNAKTTVSYVITQPASSLVDLGNMISYENWHKAE